METLIKTEKSFLNQYGMDDTGAGVVRFFGSIFIASTSNNVPAIASVIVNGELANVKY